MAELPRMEKLRKKEQELGFRILLLNWKDRLEKTRKIMERSGCGIPVLLDCRSYARKVLFVNYTPTLFIVDEEGIIRSRIVGAPDNIEEIVVEVLGNI
ncbi:MAG: TlpA family protein disulfide reductase [Candidatus Krumholzibacteriota bacterium]